MLLLVTQDSLPVRGDSEGADPALLPSVVAFIAAEDGMAERILNAHMPDRHGRCRGCPNSRTLNAPWPCMLHRAAATVRRDALSRAKQRWERS
jgi:hypothetical protein